MRKLYYIIMIPAIFLAGCANETSTTDEREPGIVDYITGAEQIKTYKKTKSKIEEINKTTEERNAGF